MKFGRYSILFGTAVWFQSHEPFAVRRLLPFLWLLKEIKLTDVDKKQQFHLGSKLVHNGRRYRYYKAGADIKVGNSLKRMQT